MITIAYAIGEELEKLQIDQSEGKNDAGVPSHVISAFGSF